jgi:hypothetical protein
MRLRAKRPATLPKRHPGVLYSEPGLGGWNAGTQVLSSATGLTEKSHSDTKEKTRSKKNIEIKKKIVAGERG